MNHRKSQIKYSDADSGCYFFYSIIELSFHFRTKLSKSLSYRKITYLSGRHKVICYFLYLDVDLRVQVTTYWLVFHRSRTTYETWLPGHQARATEINRTHFLLSTTGFGQDTEGKWSKMNRFLLWALTLTSSFQNKDQHVVFGCWRFPPCSSGITPCMEHSQLLGSISLWARFENSVGLV